MYTYLSVITLGGNLTNAAAAQGNAFTGDTVILGGILVLGESVSIRNSAFDTSTSIAGTAADGLRVTPTAITLGGLKGANDFSTRFTSTSGGYSALTALTLNPSTDVTNSYAGDIGNGSGSMTLTKTGAGTQVLTGTNTNTGATDVSVGTLRVNGSTHSSSNFTVASGATLGGVGTVAGTVTVSGNIAPGNGVTDALELTTGATTWNASTFKFELVGSASDKLTVNGGLTKGTGSAFVFDFMGSTPIENGVYTLMSFDSQTGFANSDFSYTGLAPEFTGMGFFTVTATTLEFTAVPEASNLLIGGLLGLGLMSRRRKQA